MFSTLRFAMEKSGNHFIAHPAQVHAFQLLGLCLTKDDNPDLYDELAKYWLDVKIDSDSSLDMDKIYNVDCEPVIINLAIPNVYYGEYIQH